MSLTRIFLASSLLALSSAACTSELDGSFSDASLEERDLAIQTAMGAPIVAGGLVLFFADFAAAGEGSCLERTVDGDTVILRGSVAGDCATEAGFTGEATVRGWDDFTDEDLEDSISMRFDAFAMIDDEGSTITVDGTIEVDQAADGRGTTVVDVSATVDGKTYALAATIECDAEPGLCRYRDASGSTSTLAFEIGGTYRDGKGVLELTGDQRMVIDFDRASDRCAPVTIDGQSAAEFCKPESGDESAAE